MADTIDTQIRRLETAKADIRTSIINKMVDVPTDAKMDVLSTYIDKIKMYITDDDFRDELVARGYDVPLNKSDAYYRAIAESKYKVITSIIKPDGKKPRIDLPAFKNFNASEYQAELYGYIMTSTQGTTAFFSTRNDSTNDGKFDFLRNKGGNTLRYVRNGRQAYISSFNTSWHTFYLGDEGFVTDGALTPWNGSPTSGAISENQMCLFASNPSSNTDPSIGNNFGECGFSYLKFFHFGKLIYYFFPILLDNEVCLYDAVGDQVYHNSGTDFFTTNDTSVNTSLLGK